MKRIIYAITFLVLLIFGVLYSCDRTDIDDNPDAGIEKSDRGMLDIHFVYNIQGVPRDRVKRADLSLAYSADSLFRGEFFRATNVSDAKTTYRFYLTPGEYYYQATIICLAGGDSCVYTQFGGQYGLRMDGGKVEVVKDQLTEVSTQFH